MTVFLDIQDLTVSYGAIRAVRGVSLSIAENEIVTLVGPNGAGKSSTLNAIVGMVASKGSIFAFGETIAGLSPEAILRRAITLCPEGRRIFSDLSIEENLVLGGAGRFGRAKTTENIERMYGIFSILGERRRQLAGTLSGGEQQQLAIARALMSEPRILLLDEPSLGLAPQIVDTIFGIIESMREWRQTVLLVEQNVERALKLADRAYVMVNGKIQMQGTAADILSDGDVQGAYFGVG